MYSMKDKKCNIPIYSVAILEDYFVLCISSIVFLVADIYSSILSFLLYCSVTLSFHNNVITYIIFNVIILFYVNFIYIMSNSFILIFFFFNDTATTEIYTY